MTDKFWLGFADELEKAAAENPGIVSRAVGGLKALGGKLKSGVKLTGLAGLAGLGYLLYNAVHGVTQAHRELQQEGQL